MRAYVAGKFFNGCQRRAARLRFFNPLRFKPVWVRGPPEGLPQSATAKPGLYRRGPNLTRGELGMATAITQGLG